ncbi:Altered inheritance of mitochondria protein 41, mitochondrial [Colletotrichum tanaceti]|uniref:Altered inheritance of mitochondria protein 41 n=1 Tax=Colletotrichum tanaceti TaxID=1306861 RepID=A0A4U6XEH2_9PEZI|nr:Altered inheritance of mitochondria protein 41, mitochondrial [Colletotrichum tanaceti]TKW54065.1 Altered inheritance of mitochondria protein 41, mitochondrial [Colletotrichum tanaceti]
MASRSSARLLQALQPVVPRRVAPLRTTLRLYSSDAAPAQPRLLATLKSDLKTAMRAKDAARLSVLRSVLSATNNAAKTSSPIATDAQLVALLRKTQRATQDAAAQFRAAGRDDLADKEDLQAKVMAEYIATSGVVAVTEADVRVLIAKAVEDVAAAGKSGLGEVMKLINAAIQGKDLEVDKRRVAELVKEALKKE